MVAGGLEASEGDPIGPLFMNQSPFLTDPELIGRIHGAAGKLVLCTTGGGSLAVSSLLQAPGASRSVLEAAVPYAAEALTRWLGAWPEQFCSDATARAMAMSAYLRAMEYVADGSDQVVAGIGCTASLASDRPKHGPHRIHAALQTGALTLAHCIELVKGRRTREEEEQLAAALVLNLVAEFKKLPDRLDLGLSSEEVPSVRRAVACPAWQLLLSGAERLAPASALAVGSSSPAARRIIFPGAFHPRHEGHRAMAALATQITGGRVEHEISIVNVDKLPIDFIEMECRAAQFAAAEPLWFTRTPTFAEKATLFPAATFVVGVDTVVRIAEPKYYGDEPARDWALASLAAAGCRFLVFGRYHDGCFQALCDLKLPTALLQLCDEVPGHAFRMDLSSTALRRSTADA